MERANYSSVCSVIFLKMDCWAVMGPVLTNSAAAKCLQKLVVHQKFTVL